MAGGIVLPDGRRRMDAIREDYGNNMRRSDIARKYGVAFQIVYQATRDMGSSDGSRSRLPSQSGGVAVTSAKRTTPPKFVPSLTVKADGGFHEPEFVEEISPVEEDLFPPS